MGQIHADLTYGTVVSFPSRAAFTFSIFAFSMLRAVRVARPFFTSGPYPTFFTLAHSFHTNTVGAAIQCAELCEKDKTGDLVI